MTKPRTQSLRGQFGGTLVLVLAFAAVLSVGLLMIYNTSQQLVAKRELVNAADAAAYSGATVIAQGLNYTAYTNRAILANHALVGQMMSIRSTLAMSHWYWKSNQKMWKAFSMMTKWIPIVGTFLGATGDAFSYFAKYWSYPVYGMQKVAEYLSNISQAAIALTNGALFVSQQLHLADSAVMFAVHMKDIAIDNAPGAELDPLMTTTLFGPAATVAGVALDFKMKFRKSEQTFDDPEKNKNDEYLNYVTETNRNVATPAYLGGRSLIPNAVSLWIAPPGCNVGEEYLMTPNFNPSMNVFPVVPGSPNSPETDLAIEMITQLKNIIALVGEKYFCMHERGGGAELVQLKGGRFAWMSVDVMNVTIPLLSDLPDIIKGVSLANIPMAGGGAMSFGEDNPTKQMETIIEFKNYITSTNTSGGELKGKYLGHQVALPADCVEFMVPGLDPDMRAVSTDMRISGRCAVLASGFEHNQVNRGLWATNLEAAAGRVMLDHDAPLIPNPGDVGAEIVSGLQLIFQNALNDYKTALTDAVTPAQPDLTGILNPPPAGVSNNTNTASASMGNTTRMDSLGSASKGKFSSMKASAKANLSSMIFNNLDPRRLGINFQGVAAAAAQIPPGADENEYVSIGMRARDAIRDYVASRLNTNPLIDFLQMPINDPIELPHPKLNSLVRFFGDGLPPYFWDVRVIDLNQGRNALVEKDLTYTDDEPNNYHQRMYNLGPVVYTPLLLAPPSVKVFKVPKTTTTTLASYETGGGSTLRAIGKARIFFRQPSDQWMNRYKVRVNKSLLLPFWQVRNESLSYVEKWTLLSLQGLASVTSDIEEPADEDTQD
jgi:hypothetical protein